MKVVVRNTAALRWPPGSACAAIRSSSSTTSWSRGRRTSDSAARTTSAVASTCRGWSLRISGKFKDDLRRTVARRLAGEAGRRPGRRGRRHRSADASDGAPTLPALAVDRTFPAAAIDPAPLTIVRSSSKCGRPGARPAARRWRGCRRCRRSTATAPPFSRSRSTRSSDDVAEDGAWLKPNYPIVMGTPEVIKAFGAVAAVPKLIISTRGVAAPRFSTARRRICTS